MTVFAFVPDLMDRSRFGGAVRFVRSVPSDAVSGDVVIVDLDRCDEPGQFVLPGCAAIGYGSHVDTERHDQARLLGYDQVLPRSRFFRDLPSLLGEANG